MARAPRKRFSQAVSVFQDRRLPEPARPAGYAALIDAYDLKVPLPRTLSAIGTKHKTILQDGWRILTPRHEPEATLEGHLTFALKHEGLDLAVVKRLFLAAGGDEIAALVRTSPTGGYARRIWFLYEWLLGDALDLPNATRGAYVPVVDPKLQWEARSVTSTRHRVKNNLPGMPEFCPLVFRTEELDRFVAMNLADRARKIVAKVPKDILARAAAFLLLKDSKSSYVIEGEDPPQDRVQRWGRAIGEAGRQPLDAEELLRLQRIVIGDARFVHLGLRREGGFVGEHDRHSGAPLPDHVNARPEDLASLLGGLIAFDRGAMREMDTVVAAAMLAFGFVYIHPFEDGNGRIHRYLIHHVLARRGFNPPGVVFPVSAAILDRIDDYRKILETYSTRLLPTVRWEPTDKGNVRVLNDTGDFYRFFDATPHAEFLYQCVLKTIEEDLPNEAAFLRRYDRFRTRVEALVDMPGHTIDLLFRMLRQNGGRLSKRARQREFAKLTEAEVRQVEEAYADTIEASA
jgi:Fic/DOC family protein